MAFIFSEGGKPATIDDRVHSECSLVVAAVVAEVADKPDKQLFKRPPFFFIFLLLPPLLVNPSALCGSLLFDSPSVFLSDVRVSPSSLYPTANPKQQTTRPKKSLETHTVQNGPKKNDLVCVCVCVGWRLSVVGDKRNNKKPSDE